MKSGAVLLLTLSAFASAASNARAQDEPDWSKIEIKSERVAGSVYMLYGVGGFAGGNIGVSVGEDGVVLVDDQFAPLVPKIEAALKDITTAPVRFILNTHFHGDHTNGNAVFGSKSVIVAQDNVRKRILARDDFGGKPGTPAPKQALPIITFDSRVSIHLNGEDIRGIHFPAGHTDGDTVVHFTESNVVHMGDDFFNGMYPFIDLESGGSVKGYAAAVQTVLSELPADVKIIPGHGSLATKGDLERYLAMLNGSIAAVEKGIEEGKTVDQLKAAKILAKYDAEWGGGFLKSDAFIAELYNGLKGIQKNPDF